MIHQQRKLKTHTYSPSKNVSTQKSIPHPLPPNPAPPNKIVEESNKQLPAPEPGPRPANGPLLISPLTEIYGRRWVLYISMSGSWLSISYFLVDVRVSSRLRDSGERLVIQDITPALNVRVAIEALLATHPLLQVIAIFQAFNYGVTYIVLSSFASLWTEQYHERVDTSGLHYIALALGEIVGSQIAGKSMDRLWRRFKAKARAMDEIGVPEWHLPMMLPATLVMPAGLLIYNWAAAYHIHGIVVDLGVFLYPVGGQALAQPLQAYLIDSYPEFTGSANAATRFVSSMCAFGFPLFAPSMYRVLGYSWGNTTIAGVALVLLAPAPLLLWRFGARLRTKVHMSY
ncbi:hypothetical protein LTR62_003997 [Meristemomyces frigidus]|uniref:Uncharacterized protein n=1 Tax=Meristemomyces frigidus TaxID=1508187 RepID=A0AAN7YN37_9PEZI|nr:hypothetical protein LTR62_003997 [Meristemomyces frigidus]